MLQWQSQEAKAKFSEVLRLSKEAPQSITVRGVEEAVLLSKEYYDALTKSKPSLFQMMQNSPLCNSGIELTRDKSLPRDTDL